MSSSDVHEEDSEPLIEPQFSCERKDIIFAKELTILYISSSRRLPYNTLDGCITSGVRATPNLMIEETWDEYSRVNILTLHENKVTVELSYAKRWIEPTNDYCACFGFLRGWSLENEDLSTYKIIKITISDDFIVEEERVNVFSEVLTHLHQLPTVRPNERIAIPYDLGCECDDERSKIFRDAILEHPFSEAVFLVFYQRNPLL
jgi:hypothetical protein